MRRFVGQALAFAGAAVVGAIACAGIIFFLHGRLEDDLITEPLADTPTSSTLPDSVQKGSATTPTAVREKAETTAGTVVQSAQEAQATEVTEAAGAEGRRKTGGGVKDNGDELLELLAGEAQTAVARLGAELAALRQENARLEARAELLGRRLAEAMEALDANAASGMPPPAEDPVLDGPLEGQVVDVNPELGLAVVDLGSRHGVRYGLPLTVLRGRRKVARLRVIDVREVLSGAAIEEKADAEGPKPGDRAVLAGTAGPEGK